MKKLTYKDFKNPKIAQALKDSFIELSDIELHEGDLVVDGSCHFFEDDIKAYFIRGNLIVSETITLFPKEFSFFIVDGDVKAKNFINISGGQNN